MKTLTFILVVSLYFLINKANAQTFTNYTTATTSTKLCNNSVNAIAIDTQGNKWFGTSGGVSKYDGTTWTTYTTSDGLIDNKVCAISIDFQDNKGLELRIGLQSKGKEKQVCRSLMELRGQPIQKQMAFQVNMSEPLP